jgi:hypothetical protein
MNNMRLAITALVGIACGITGLLGDTQFFASFLGILIGIIIISFLEYGTY